MFIHAKSSLPLSNTPINNWDNIVISLHSIQTLFFHFLTSLVKYFFGGKFSTIINVEKIKFNKLSTRYGYKNDSVGSACNNMHTCVTKLCSFLFPSCYFLFLNFKFHLQYFSPWHLLASLSYYKFDNLSFVVLTYIF
jgi:hypothetical protein